MTRRRIMLAAGLLLAGLFLLLWRGSPPQPFTTPPEHQGASAQLPERPTRLPAARPLPRFVSTIPAYPFGRFFLPPHDAYATEGRDDGWALAMENALRTWMSPEALRQVGLARLEIVDLSCKRTACRLEYEYPTALLDLVTRRGLPPDESPLVLVMEVEGPLAPRGSARRTQSFVRDGERYQRVSTMLGFDEGSIDPARHALWARDHLAEEQLVIERVRMAWQAMQARKQPRPAPDAG